MSSREQAVQLCKEGDERLATKELSQATAFYTAAFSCSAPVTLQKVESLGKESRGKVIATLETWCRGRGSIPKVQCSSLSAPLPNVGIAAVFLSTLSPNNLAASLCKMEALLALGRCQEVVSRCDALLDVHPCVELLLLRALALVLSGHPAGLPEYLHAFRKHRDETVRFVSGKQKGHLQQILGVFLESISSRETCGRSLDSWQRDCYDFLVAVAPEDIHVCRAHAAHLLEKHKYTDCLSVYSKALQALSNGNAFGDEQAAGLLMGRAAAYFSLGGHVQEMLGDLTAAFGVSPKLAKKCFKELFSALDAERIEKHARATLNVDFIAYREAVRTRPEIRSNGGKELLAPVIHTLQFLIQISPGARRELNVRLADCYLLDGNIEGALGICNLLLGCEQETYSNTLLALRGFCHLHAKRYQDSLRDFQEIIEHNSPHPSSCIKALCGRGLIRVLGGNPYLAALDYVTACRLRFDETSFAIKSYIPWNHRGFLLVVLQEEAQKILEKTQNTSGSMASRQNKPGGLNEVQVKEGDASGVHQLACLLLDLDASDEVSQILCADALYQMERVEEAHKILLVALSKTSQRSAILARLAFLQLKKGFLYDCNQHLKKMTQAGDTCGFLSVVKVLKDGDQTLLSKHCHARAMTLLKNKQGEGYIKEAITYLSFAITAAGGFGVDSLLARARCYGQLGQRKTAIFDFNTILKVDPENVQALSGRGFIHLALNQKEEAVHDLTSALQANPASVVTEILTLKPEAQFLIHQWLLDHCRNVLLVLVAGKELSGAEVLKELTVLGESLLEINRKEAKSHIIYVDILTANGRHKEALAHLQASFVQATPDDAVNARLGILQASKGNMNVAAHILAGLAATDYEEFGFLMNFLDTKRRQKLTQVASKEGNALVKEHCHAKAVGYYSLAILASNDNPRYLRQRATCLAHLKDYRKALKDMEKVVQNHGQNDLRTQVEDFCSQGYMLMSLAEEEAAVKQYIRALQLEQSLALTTIHADPDRDALSKAFLQTAQSYFTGNRYEDAWTTVEYGLIVDQNHHELKKLKSRIKREASGCSVH
ncbi:tetratricopeptide repeat protein 34 [Tiliqua scincoides]|uniref:tetratricopeptide repeat protein 34 n=1 Tax=Tiliqua scincoides TaxID=71010 RepID=UPI003462971F